MSSQYWTRIARRSLVILCSDSKVIDKHGENPAESGGKPRFEQRTVRDGNGNVNAVRELEAVSGSGGGGDEDIGTDDFSSGITVHDPFFQHVDI